VVCKDCDDPDASPNDEIAPTMLRSYMTWQFCSTYKQMEILLHILKTSAAKKPETRKRARNFTWIDDKLLSAAFTAGQTNHKGLSGSRSAQHVLYAVVASQASRCQFAAST